MRITGIQAHVAPAAGGSWVDETLVANPMSRYPRFKERRSSWRGPGSQRVYVEVLTDEGVTGLGATQGGAVTKAIVEQHLAELLAGSDPRDVELLWDQMFRATLPYGRKGVVLMAISGVDLALWDLTAKSLGQPLYRLLGGATRESLPTYATHPDPAALVREGYFGMKVPMAHGPTDGNAGLRANLERVATARDAVGPDIDLMVDCYMAWDVEYTVTFAQEARPYNLRWIEEALPPDEYDGYAELRRRLPWLQIATGEHEFTHWGFRELLKQGCADIIQPDLTWCGGITEARRIAGLASSFNVPVIPHAGGLQPWTVHWMFATPACSFAETLVFGNAGRAPVMQHEITVRDGHIQLPERPGAGVALDHQELARQVTDAGSA